jgi:WD40 repeat protein
MVGHHGLIELTSSGALAVLSPGTLSNRLTVVHAIQGDTILSLPFGTGCCAISNEGLASSADGQLVAGSVNSALIVVDLSSRTALLANEYTHTLASMGALAFASDDSQLLIGGQMRGVMVMDLPSGQLADSLPQVSVVGISIMPDGRTAALARFNGEILLWNWKEHAVVDTLTDCESWCASLARSEHTLMAGCGGGTIRVWDLQTLQFRGLMRGHPYIGYGFSAGHGGDLMIVGSGPGSPNNPDGLTTSEILVFDVSTLQPIASWRAHDARGILDTAMTPDGSLFATLGYDGMIDIWRLNR